MSKPKMEANGRWRDAAFSFFFFFVLGPSSDRSSSALVWRGANWPDGASVPPPSVPSIPSAFDTLDVSRVKEWWGRGGERCGESRGEVRSSELEMCHLLGLGPPPPDPRHPPPPPNWI